MNVEELLAEKDIYFRNSGADFVVKCLSPEHDDINPSMRIDRITGIFNCFSCGFKGNLFKLYGAAENYLDTKREKLRRKIGKVTTDTVGLDFPKDYTPVAFPWRGISAETLIKFEAFKHKDFEDRIVFPLRDIRGKIVAFIGRAIDNRLIGKERYMIEPKGVQLPLFPIPIKAIKGRVIMVEGILDMLNLYDKGLRNVLTVFGTNAMNEQKLSLLKIMGIYGIDIVFDGDTAGQEGASKLADLCTEMGMNSRVIELHAGSDPGEMDNDRVGKLKDYLYSSKQTIN